MSNGSRGTMFRRSMLAVAAVLFFVLPLGGVSAEEEGTFEGSLIANGSRQRLEFMEGREVGIFSIEGHINLTNALGEAADFWAKWVGLWDSETGGSVRCVWNDLHGHKIYGVLNGTRLKKGASLSGEFVGGTGPFQGIQGEFTFTWTSVFYETDDKVLAGYAKDVKGSYRLP